MAKHVKLSSGRELKPLTTAKAFFSGLRERTPLNAHLRDPERTDVLDIYRRYCGLAETAAYDAVDVTVILDEKPRRGGNYAQTARTFAIVTAAGSKTAFNIEKALQAVAK